MKLFAVIITFVGLVALQGVACAESLQKQDVVSTYDDDGDDKSSIKENMSNERKSSNTDMSDKKVMELANDQLFTGAATPDSSSTTTPMTTGSVGAIDGVDNRSGNTVGAGATDSATATAAITTTESATPMTTGSVDAIDGVDNHSATADATDSAMSTTMTMPMDSVDAIGGVDSDLATILSGNSKVPSGDSVTNDSPKVGNEGTPFDDVFTSATDTPDEDKIPRKLYESILQVRKRFRKDPRVLVTLFEGLNGEPPYVRVYYTGGKAAEIIKLTPGTELTLSDEDSFAISNKSGTWKFKGRNLIRRETWVIALHKAIDSYYRKGPKKLTGAQRNALIYDDEIEKSFKEGLGILHESILRVPRRMRKDRRVWVELFKGPEGELPYLRVSDVPTAPFTRLTGVEVIKLTPGTKARWSKKDTFEVINDSGSWKFAGSNQEQRDLWMSAIHKAKNSYAAEQAGMPIDPACRGTSLGPREPPLEVGQYLSNLNPAHPVTLEATAVGDLLLTHGAVPERNTDPKMASRTPSNASGGLLCVVEARVRGVVGKDEPATRLSVKNGRWRVGRGPLCTLGRSPPPAGSIRRFIPGDARGKAIREASLTFSESDNLVIASGSDVLWDSSVG